jgi:hypothetical protein
MDKMDNIPSEHFLVAQRRTLFWDEWLFYLTLGGLFFYSYYWMVVIVGIFGATAITFSYRRQWQYEAMRFGKLEREDNE